MTFPVSFEAAKAQRDLLEAKVSEFGAVLKAFPKAGPLGLTPDEVKSSFAYRRAKDNYDTAFRRLREFNAAFTKRFAADIRAAR